MESSNIVHAENTETRLESRLKTIKLYRNITKVHKIMCFNQTKISTLVITFDVLLSLLLTLSTDTTTQPLPKFDSRQPQAHARTLPTPPALFSRLIELMWTVITMVQLQRSSFIDIPLEHIGDFENFFWMVTSKFISADKKHLRSWQYGKKDCRNWCQFDFFII